MSRYAKCLLSVLSLAVLILPASAQNLRTGWAYHAAEGLEPAEIPAPAVGQPFLVSSGRPDTPVVIWVLTNHDFAGPLKEQVYVRWWDGRMAHWVAGAWSRNVSKGDCPMDAPWADPLPDDRMFDLWRVEIPSWIPQPGENFYAIQLKAVGASEPLERYLLARGGGDFSRTNDLGQVWSSSEEFDGQDWRVVIAQ